MATTEQMQYLGGLLGGLESGVNSYQSAKARQEQKQSQMMQRALELKKSGYTQNPETGELTEEQATPEYIKQYRGLLEGAGFEHPEEVIPEGVSRRALEEGAVSKAISGSYGMQGRLLSNDRMSERNRIMGEQLSERKNKSATQAGQDFEHDPILKTSKTSLNSLNRSSSILENPNKPVTTKDLNLAYQDYINAVAAGGTATEGKIQRELPETWEQDWNAFKSKAGEFDDLRKTDTGRKLIQMLHENIRTVKGDLNNAMADQATNIHESYKYNNNQQVKKTVDDKLKKYGGGLPSQQKGLVEKPQDSSVEMIGDKKYMKLPNGDYQEVE